MSTAGMDAPPADAIKQSKLLADMTERKAKRDRLDHIEGTIRLLHGANVVELRAINATTSTGAWRGTLSGYFDDPRKAAESAESLKAATGIYVTLNRVKPDLLARSMNKLSTAAKDAATTKDKDVLAYAWLLIDVDAIRDPHISASVDEHEAAHERARKIVAWLSGQGWPVPIVADSGNGAHALYRIDLPVEDGPIVKGCLEALAGRFDDDCVKVDRTVFNPSRITKLYGTRACKGSDAGALGRPWRYSGLVDVPDRIEVVPRELLEALAAKASPKANASGNSQHHQHNAHDAGGQCTGARPRLLVESYLSDRGVKIVRTKPCGEGTTYIIERCPFDPSHGGNGEVSVSQPSRGGVTFACMHNSCAAYGWNQFKAAVGAPDAHHYDPPLGQHKKPSATPPAKLAAGTKVRAKDRDNFGEVVSDDGGSCRVHFVSPEGAAATVSIPKSQLVGVDGRPIAPEHSPLRIEFISSADFAAATYHQRFLIDDVLVEGQPAIVGGRSKTMKTTMGIDLSISLGSGTPFLGRFPARRARVGFLCGESGPFTTQETARRVCAARDVTLADCDVFWGFDLPQIARAGDLDVVHDLLLSHSVEVLIIDPVYLCLLASDQRGRQASNLFDMGPLLLQLTDLGRETNATIIVVHHLRKNLEEKFGVPELEDLSMAGFAEWARQWLLLARREAYVKGTGQHRLWLNVGGSAGHSGTWAIDISEGELRRDFTGRAWNVTVGTTTDAKAERDRQREDARARQQEQTEARHVEKLRAAMRQFPAGETAKRLREVASVNSANFGPAINTLLARGEVEACDVEKAGKKHDGWRLKNQ